MVSPLETESNNSSNMIHVRYGSEVGVVSQDESESLTRNGSTSNPEHEGIQTRASMCRCWNYGTSTATIFVVGFVLLISLGGFTLHTSRGRSDDVQSYELPQTITVELEGKHRKKHNDDDGADDDGSNNNNNNEPTICQDGHYSKRTLKRAYELPFAALFRDLQVLRKYEASSVTVLGDTAYAVCDSSWAITKFDVHLSPFSSKNILIDSTDNRDLEENSGYEAFFYEDGRFYVVRESIQHSDEKYHAIIEELEVDDSSYTILDQCSTEYEFEGDSKGFEGAIAIRDLNNELVILGLCEGNHCSETRKNESGNGRLIAMRKVVESIRENDKSRCTWKTIRMINIPSSAYFLDYSGITMSPSGKVGISSQENSQLWIGQLLGQDNDTGLWNIDEIEFQNKHSTLYDFPRNDNCDIIYCNIEGVHWLNDDMIITVSDKMKGKGKQEFICHDKDQSVHVFLLPE